MGKSNTLFMGEPSIRAVRLGQGNQGVVLLVDHAHDARLNCAAEHPSAPATYLCNPRVYRVLMPVLMHLGEAKTRRMRYCDPRLARSSAPA